MKKLDLHIHTIDTTLDNGFMFDIQVLKNYIIQEKIDAIAITNHNLFNSDQYLDIKKELEGYCIVLPGIEINVGNKSIGHLLCIANENDDDFADKCANVTNSITSKEGFINFEKLKSIFINLDDYLWIPHYDKKPNVDKDFIKEMSDYILCGEVSSIKKFVYCMKEKNSLVPVYFSDFRPEKNSKIPTRSTYFDIGEINISSIKKCLLDKTKVTLTKEEGNSLFSILPQLTISTGLNVVIGERSSGKSYLLNEIESRYRNIKYIKQFELVEIDETKAAKEFNKSIENKNKDIADKYFEPFKRLVDEIQDISLFDNDNKLENYVKTLIKNAKETDKADMFSRCKIFSESYFLNQETTIIEDIINPIMRLLDNTEYKEIIEKHIKRGLFLDLLCDLVKEGIKNYEIVLKKRWINAILRDIKDKLQFKSAATSIIDVNFYDLLLDHKKINLFNKIVNELKKESDIEKAQTGEFSIKISKRAFKSAKELKSISGTKNNIDANLMKIYEENPYEFLIKLKESEYIKSNEYYRYFIKVDYNILNKYGYNISGGERAEFNLLQKIKDANQYDMLLIDEPEASFDNLFLRNNINTIIKDISASMPVILVTHNGTVGESIKPDYIIYTRRIIKDGKILYDRFFGKPSDKKLCSYAGEEISNFNVMLDCFEAGEKTYKERRRDYEILKH